MKRVRGHHSRANLLYLQVLKKMTRSSRRSFYFFIMKKAFTHIIIFFLIHRLNFLVSGTASFLRKAQVRTEREFSLLFPSAQQTFILWGNFIWVGITVR